MAQSKNSGETGQGAEEHSDPLNEQQLQSEFAKALQELNKGEQTATALESALDSIEGKIERLLAQAEESARQTSSEDVKQKSDSTDGSAPPK